MRVLDHFPGVAVRGGDLLTGNSSPNRSYEPIHQDQWGTAYRNERVLATGIVLDELNLDRGEVCFLESTVRDMGQLVGMVPIERLFAAEAALVTAYERVAELEASLAELTVVDTVVAQAVEKALTDLAPQLVGLVETAPESKAPEPLGTTADPKAAPPPTDAELVGTTKGRRR